MLFDFARVRGGSSWGERFEGAASIFLVANPLEPLETVGGSGVNVHLKTALESSKN
jgi:hypothetical protein